MTKMASRWIERTFRAETGQAIVWVAVMLPLFLSVIGLAIDGGIAFDSRRELQDVADGAARAGAMQIDQNVYRASAGASVVLDVNSAQQAAAAYVASQGKDLTATTTVSPRRIEVTVRRLEPTSFLRIVGLDSIPMAATATAEVQHGISRGSSS